MFPPHCGGAGWSAYYLAQALRDRGHTVAVVRPRFDPAARQVRVHRVEYEGLPVAELVVPAPRNPLWRLLTRNVLAPRLLRRLVEQEAHRLEADLIHAQHALTVPAAVAAAARLARHPPRRVPVVATVRDYWPLCYYSTMQVPGDSTVGSRQYAVCSKDEGVGGQGLGVRTGDPASPNPKSKIQNPKSIELARALWAAQGPRMLLRLPLLPLWQAVTARRRAALRRADATIAVSRFVAAALARGHAVRPERLHVLPNLVDLPRIQAILATPPPWAALGLAPGQPFLLFAAGKLEPTKGAGLLPAALQAAGVGRDLPLVLPGSGPLQPWLAAQAAARDLDFRFCAWLDNADMLRLMQAATVLLFPSAWEEPLSRVLLEGCAAGACILALNTGGTADIVVDGQNGRLVADMAAFAAALRALVADPAERARLAAGAQATARRQFSATIVGAQVESLYQKLLA
ncbi:MAG TPA: glycosyltransferase family 4 protein [Chloroflexia bacterium]|nr:glycosyltransferase family 4 protein [Chloroflexia bacterium]